MKIISNQNQEGASEMTLAPSLVAVLNIFNHSVLLVDIDHQGFSLDWAAGEPVDLLFGDEYCPAAAISTPIQHS